MMDQQLIYCITVMSPTFNTNTDKNKKKKKKKKTKKKNNVWSEGGTNKLWLLGALEFNDSS